MSPDPLEALKPLLTRLSVYIQRYPETSRVAADVARGLADWADALLPPIVPREVEVVPPPAPPSLPVAPPRPPVDLSQLDLNAIFRPPPSQPQIRDFGEIVPHGLPLIAQRCRVKAEAARLVGTAPTNIDRVAANTLIGRVNELPNCFLWMFDPNGTYSDRPAVWTDLAGAFEAAAACADLLHVWDELPDNEADRASRDVLYLAAEAQAVLFTAVTDAGKRGRDADQLELYISIKDRTKIAGVFVDRYMTLNDPADAAQWRDLARRTAEFAGTLRGSEERTRQRKKALDRLKHKARRLRDEADAATEEWPRVVELIDELVAGGLAPSHPEVREWLLPIVDRLPDELPLTTATKQVLREIERFQASRPNGQDEAKAEPLSEEVAEVRRLLAGRAVVFIGGHERKDRRAALIDAFDLSDLIWITTDEHESVSVFEAPISRPEVAVVLLAIRWSSHSYGDVAGFCERDGKLLVRVPGGYHANQIAHQILKQAGDRLRLGRAG